VRVGLTIRRILREIRKEGYTGGRTILSRYVRTLRAPSPPRKKVWRRFETGPGKELQVDWSPYRVEIAGKLTLVHAFGATLAHSRKIHVHFYRDEKQPTLLEAQTAAFEDFGGVTERVVYDWMSTIVLGRIGPDQKPLWHPTFLEYVEHYGYDPFLCETADPDRKGKDERIFLFLERDFLRGSTFESLEHLNREVRIWLDTIANCRNHGTTGLVPDEEWRKEQPCLTALPDSRYPTFDEVSRLVGPDSVLWVRSTPYTVPAALAHRRVKVRLYAEHFEVLHTNGQVAFSRRYVPEAEKGRLQIDRDHYQGIDRSRVLPGGPLDRLERVFLDRFPSLAELVDGIKRRMTRLTHIHLRAMWQLANRYGDEAFLEAATRAQSYRRYDAHAVRRILERTFPMPDEEPAVPLGATSRVLAELGDVDSGSLDDYAHLDTDEPEEDPTGEDDDLAGGDESHGR